MISFFTSFITSLLSLFDKYLLKERIIPGYLSLHWRSARLYIVLMIHDAALTGVYQPLLLAYMTHNRADTLCISEFKLTRIQPPRRCLTAVAHGRAMSVTVGFYFNVICTDHYIVFSDIIYCNITLFLFLCILCTFLHCRFYHPCCSTAVLSWLRPLTQVPGLHV